MSSISVLFVLAFLKSSYVHAGHTMRGAQTLQTHPLLSSIAKRARETAAARAATNALPEVSSYEHSAGRAAEVARVRDLNNAQKSLARASAAAQTVLATQAVNLVESAVQATQASDASVLNQRRLLASAKNALNAKVNAKVDAANAAAAMEQYEILLANATEAEQRAQHWKEQAEFDQESVDEARRLYDAFQAAADQARNASQNRLKVASGVLLDVTRQMVNHSSIEATQVVTLANSTGISSRADVIEANRALALAKVFDIDSKGS